MIKGDRENGIAHAVENGQVVSPKHGVFYVQGEVLRLRLPIKDGLLEKLRRGQNLTALNGPDWAKM